MQKVQLRSGTCVIDIACGTGALTREIARKLTGEGRVVGVDLNETMIEVAQSNQLDCRHVLEWYAADVTELPFGDATFDYAFIQQGLQFFPDKSAALKEVHRILRNDGQLFLTCGALCRPSMEHLQSSRTACWNRCRSQGQSAFFVSRWGPHFELVGRCRLQDSSSRAIGTRAKIY